MNCITLKLKNVCIFCSLRDELRPGEKGSLFYCEIEEYKNIFEISENIKKDIVYYLKENRKSSFIKAAIEHSFPEYLNFFNTAMLLK